RRRHPLQWPLDGDARPARGRDRAVVPRLPCLRPAAAAPGGRGPAAARAGRPGDDDEPAGAAWPHRLRSQCRPPPSPGLLHRSRRRGQPAARAGARAREDRMTREDAAIAAIDAAFRRRGGDHYGEGVSQQEHALQAAWLAEREGASPALIVAALLHDIGHLLHDLPDDVADQDIDTEHESLGSAWLSQYFGPEVSEPVRLHVAAKRYLCATEPGYL